MKKYNPTPLSWLYNQLLTKPDLTIYECTEALEDANDMNDMETILFLTWLRSECVSLSDGWKYLLSNDNTVYTDIGIYELWYNTKR
jgi:hypothetical protein